MAKTTLIHLTILSLAICVSALTYNQVAFLTDGSYHDVCIVPGNYSGTNSTHLDAYYQLNGIAYNFKTPNNYICLNNFSNTFDCALTIRTKREEAEAELFIFYQKVERVVEFYESANASFIRCVDTEQVANDECTRICYSNSTTKPCNGTTNYCNMYGCNTINSCYCRVGYYTESAILSVTIDNEKFEFPSEGYNDVEELTQYAYHTYVVKCAIGDEFLQLRTIETSQNFTATLSDENVLSIVTDNPVSFIINIKKDDFIITESVNSSYYIKKLPKEMLIESGDLEVKLFYQNDIKQTWNFKIIGTTECRFKDCIVCWDAISSFTCLPLLYKVLLIMILIIMFALALCLMPPAFFGLWFIFCLIFKPTRYVIKFFINVGRRMSGKTRRMLNKVKEKADEIVQEAPNIEPSNTRKLLSYLSIMMIISGVGAHCIDHDVISSMSEKCVMNSAECDGSGFRSLCSTCQMSTTFSFTLSRVDSAMCVDFVDQNDTLIGRAEITYDELYYEISLSREYFTSEVRGFSESIKQCSGGSFCEEGMCTSAVDRHGYGVFDTELLAWAGETSCRSPPGTGCSWFRDSCIYTYYSLVPIGVPYEVRALNQQKVIPKVNIKIFDTIGLVSESEARGIGTFKFGNYSITVNGVFQNKLTLFGNKKIVNSTDGSVTFLSEVSAVNSPDYRKFGYVQSSTVSSFLTPSKFKYDKEIVKFEYDEDETRAIFQYPNGLNWQDKLPKIINGDIWYANDSKMHCFSNEGSPLSLTFNSEKGLRMRVFSGKVCPDMKLVIASGCHNCISGFSISLKGKSTCLPGIIKIEANNVDLDTTSLILGGNEGNYTVYGKTNNVKNDFVLRFIGETTQEMKISFNAYSEDLVHFDKTDRQYYQNNDSPFDALGNFFEGIFTGFASWWQYVIFVGIVLLGLFLLPYAIRILKFAFSGLSSLMKKKKVI